MARLEETYRLIQALTKSEKRFFSRFAKMTSGESGSRYLDLFTLLADMPEFDEKRLLGSLLFPESNLPSLLNKLQKLILRSMRSLNDDREIDQKVFSALADIEFLYRKNQSDAAERSLNKALHLARKHEKYSLELKLLEWGRRLALERNRNLGKAILEELGKREKEVHQLIGLRLNLRGLHDQTRALSKQSVVLKSREQYEQLEKILAHSAMVELPGDFLSAIYFRSIQSMIATVKGDGETAYEFSHKLILEWEDHPEMIGVHPDLFLGNLNNYITVALMQGADLQILRKHLGNARTLKSVKFASMLKLQRITLSQEFLVTMNLGTYQEGISLVAEIDEWLAEMESHLPDSRIIRFHYNISSFYFLSGNFKAANKRLQKVINFPGATERQDIREFARLLQLILHIELGNYGLLEYLLRSTSRYFKATGHTTEFESLILKLVQKLLASDREVSELKACYETFHTEIHQLRDRIFAESQAAPLGLGEMVIWAESKSSGRSIRLVFEEHSGRI